VFTDMAGAPYRYDGSEIENRRGIVACSASVLKRILPVVQKAGRAAGLI
jgi:3'(2'), 5'-bisphosphate nucleotidase